MGVDQILSKTSLHYVNPLKLGFFRLFHHFFWIGELWRNKPIFYMALTIYL